MGTGIAIAACLAIVAVILYYARKGGADGAKSAAVQEALKDVTDANRPVAVSERELLQSKYRRD